MSDTLLITGANRGIGLDLTRTSLGRGHRVIAACRRPEGADELSALASEHLEIVALDVGDDASISALVAALGGRSVDALINNAGRMKREPGVDGIDREDWLHTFAINAIAPLRVATALKPNLLRSRRARVLTVSSQMGSLERAGTGDVAYRSSKAAVNMAMRCLADEWSADGITVCTVHPGWVRSDMGGAGADLSTAESAADLVALLERLTPADTGRFLNHDGASMPW